MTFSVFAPVRSSAQARPGDKRTRSGKVYESTNPDTIVECLMSDTVGGHRVDETPVRTFLPTGVLLADGRLAIWDELVMRAGLVMFR